MSKYTAHLADSVSLSAVGHNLSGTFISAGLVIAMYNAAGKLLAVEIDKNYLEAYSNGDFEISKFSVPDDCAEVKWFMWNFDSLRPFE